MKKKLQKKLAFNKSTVANLDRREQGMIMGGELTDPLSTCDTGACTTCNTYCGTCYTCNQTCDCYTLDCETERPQYCDPFPV